MAITIKTNSVPVGKLTCASALVGGGILDTDGRNVLETGILYSKTSRPDLASNQGHIKLGTKKGSFQTMLNNLDQDTIYYVRAYAILAGNPVMNCYGPEVSFRTCQALQIGSRIWMTSNLNVDVYNDGNLIPQVKTQSEYENANNDQTAAWSWYNWDIDKYGRLYNKTAKNNPNLVPPGWRVANFVDWKDLLEAGGNKFGSSLADQYRLFADWGASSSGGNWLNFSAKPGGFYRWSMFRGAKETSDTELRTGWWSESDHDYIEMDRYYGFVLYHLETFLRVGSMNYIRICKNL